MSLYWKQLVFQMTCKNTIIWIPHKHQTWVYRNVNRNRLQFFEQRQLYSIELTQNEI